MPECLGSHICQHEEAIIRHFVEQIYNDRRTELHLLLSYEQLINHLPDLLSDLARLIDEQADEDEIAETARRLRTFAQVRFHQGALLDEAARELITLRHAVGDFLCREKSATLDEAAALCAALRCTDRFVDELLAQTLVTYAASLRPPIKTRTSVWPPPRRRKTDSQKGND